MRSASTKTPPTNGYRASVMAGSKRSSVRSLESKPRTRRLNSLARRESNRLAPCTKSSASRWLRDIFKAIS
jgi:hypothetical protein